jgi:hypothetical protein
MNLGLSPVLFWARGPHLPSAVTTSNELFSRPRLPSNSAHVHLPAYASRQALLPHRSGPAAGSACKDRLGDPYEVAHADDLRLALRERGVDERADFLALEARPASAASSSATAKAGAMKSPRRRAFPMRSAAGRTSASMKPIGTWRTSLVVKPASSSSTGGASGGPGGCATGSAVGVAALLRRAHAGVDLPLKPMTRGVIAGSLVFGAGWALAGACPGTALAQIGERRLSGLVVFAGIGLGAWLHGLDVRRAERYAASP